MNNEILISFLFFITGCLFGSFSSVLIHRTLHNQSGILFGKSRCPKCKHELKALDLIPLLSWIIKRGRCSYCHAPISPVYPSLELICGLLFLTNYNMISWNPNFSMFNNFSTDWLLAMKIIFLDLIVLNLIAITFSDLQKKAIPNLFLYTWIGITALAFLLTGPDLPGSILDRCLAVSIALFFFGGQILVSKGKWLGSGDVFVAVGMALLLGTPKLLVAIVFSYLTGSVISLGLLFLQKVKFKQTIPFAPFLILGTLISLYNGNDIVNWYLHLTLII